MRKLKQNEWVCITAGVIGIAIIAWYPPWRWTGDFIRLSLLGFFVGGFYTLVITWLTVKALKKKKPNPDH